MRAGDGKKKKKQKPHSDRVGEETTKKKEEEEEEEEEKVSELTIVVECSAPREGVQCQQRLKCHRGGVQRIACVAPLPRRTPQRRDAL